MAYYCPEVSIWLTIVRKYLYGLLLSGSVSLQIVIAGNGFSSSDEKLSYLSVIKLFPDLIKQNDMNIRACGKLNM